MFESNYRKLFYEFSKNLHKLVNARSASGVKEPPYNYIFFVCDKDGKTTNWASGVTNSINYVDGEIVEKIIHEIIIDGFRDLGKTVISKEEYKDHVHDLITELFDAGNERLDAMPDDIFLIDTDIESCY